jgi:hypothetical protein
MALTDFFNINLPYGLKRNRKNQWIAFNREYLPLGWSCNDDVTQTVGHNDVYQDMPLYAGYPTLTEDVLKKIAWGEEGIRKDEEGKICMVFLYADGTNPKKDSVHWKNYFDKIQILSKIRKKEKVY